MAPTPDQTRRSPTRTSRSQGNISFHDEVKTKPDNEDKNEGNLGRPLSTKSRNISFVDAANLDPPERWTAALEARLDVVKAKMWEAQKSWSEEQEIYVKEYDELVEMKLDFEKFSKRRLRDQKKEGSRFKVAAASTSQTNSDDEGEAPDGLKGLTSILRRTSSSRPESEIEQDNRLGYASTAGHPRKLTRAQTSTSFVSAFTRRRSLRNNSEDDTDAESPTSGFAVRIFRRASTSKSANASGDESTKPGIVNKILRRASTSAAIDSEKEYRKIKKHGKR